MHYKRNSCVIAISLVHLLVWIVTIYHIVLSRILYVLIEKKSVHQNLVPSCCVRTSCRCCFSGVARRKTSCIPLPQMVQEGDGAEGGGVREDLFPVKSRLWRKLFKHSPTFPGLELGNLKQAPKGDSSERKRGKEGERERGRERKKEWEKEGERKKKEKKGRKKRKIQLSYVSAHICGPARLLLMMMMFY